jgi:hypothetical protein
MNYFFQISTPPVGGLLKEIFGLRIIREIINRRVGVGFTHLETSGQKCRKAVNFYNSYWIGFKFTLSKILHLLINSPLDRYKDVCFIH